ncbi:hypothetical protein TNCV_1424821 [Trichonephila clavipes]|nr:hypothetical protein TNCV_1424821 [Trichonephila clavipes]
MNNTPYFQHKVLYEEHAFNKKGRSYHSINRIYDTGPQAAGDPTCVTTVQLTGLSFLKKVPGGVWIWGLLRISYSSGLMSCNMANTILSNRKEIRNVSAIVDSSAREQLNRVKTMRALGTNMAFRSGEAEFNCAGNSIDDHNNNYLSWYFLR